MGDSDGGNSLVLLKPLNGNRQQAVVSTLDIARNFGKRHANILRDIDRLLADASRENRRTLRQWFQESYYLDRMRRNYRIYYVNRDGFALLVMGMTGKAALDWKMKYIAAFDAMERLLAEKSLPEWLTVRREAATSTIAANTTIDALIRYAKAQGSTHSDKLYFVYQKLANRTAGIDNGSRNRLTLSQLAQLNAIERLIRREIENGMAANMHYKDIYQCVKAMCQNYYCITGGIVNA